MQMLRGPRLKPNPNGADKRAKERTWRFLCVWWACTGLLVVATGHWAYSLVFLLLAALVHFTATDPAPSSAENR